MEIRVLPFFNSLKWGFDILKIDKECTVFMVSLFNCSENKASPSEPFVFKRLLSRNLFPFWKFCTTLILKYLINQSTMMYSSYNSILPFTLWDCSIYILTNFTIKFPFHKNCGPHHFKQLAPPGCAMLVKPLTHTHTDG